MLKKIDDNRKQIELICSVCRQTARLKILLKFSCIVSSKATLMSNC